MRFDISRSWITKQLCVNNELDELLVTFGSSDNWERVQRTPRKGHIDLGPHEWWRRLDVEDVSIVLEKLRPIPE